MVEQAPKNEHTAADAEREREERRRQHEAWKQKVDWEHRSGIERIGLLMMYAAGKYQERKTAAQEDGSAEAKGSPAAAPALNPGGIPEKIEKDPLLKWLWNFRQKRVKQEEARRKENSGGFTAGDKAKLAGALGGLALWPIAWSVGQVVKYLIVFDFGKNESDMGHIDGDAVRAMHSAYTYATRGAPAR